MITCCSPTIPLTSENFHYWIVDPRRRTVLTLVLRGTAYEVAGEFSGDEVLTGALFPGLALPLARLFRS
jgi:Uma2 family endonuclease